VVLTDPLDGPWTNFYSPGYEGTFTSHGDTLGDNSESVWKSLVNTSVFYSRSCDAHGSQFLRKIRHWFRYFVLFASDIENIKISLIENSALSCRDVPVACTYAYTFRGHALRKEGYLTFSPSYLTKSGKSGPLGPSGPSKAMGSLGVAHRIILHASL
jgi:hypothetical protein